MNIEQIKQDLEAGIMVSRSTIVALVEAALLMEDSLLAAKNGEQDGGAAADLLARIDAM